MKQAFAFLALVALVQDCNGLDTVNDWSEGVVKRHHRRSPLPRSEVLLEKSSSGLATAVLWSRLHNAESLAETERQVLVAQQEALQALQREQEALSAREAKTEAMLKERRLQPAPPAPSPSAEALPSEAHASHARTHRITRGVEFVVTKQHTGDRPGLFSSLRTNLASLWRRCIHPLSAHHFHKKATDSASDARHISFLAKGNSREHRESPEDSGKPFPYGHRLWYHVGVLGFCVLQAFICGVVYEQCCKVEYPLLPESAVREEEWQFGLCELKGWTQDWRICLFAFCCPSARWADTVSRLQPPVMGFLPALFVFSLLEGASTLSFGASAIILFLLVVLSRVRVREAYGISSGECGIISDCAVWCCCAPCAIVQEARQVEYVKPPPIDY